MSDRIVTFQMSNLNFIVFSSGGSPCVKIQMSGADHTIEMNLSDLRLLGNILGGLACIIETHVLDLSPGVYD